MDERRFKDWTEFFRSLGDDYIHPKSYGECLFPVTVEEMYQHFKVRMLDELREASGAIGHDDMSIVIDRVLYRASDSAGASRITSNAGSEMER